VARKPNNAKSGQQGCQTLWSKETEMVWQPWVVQPLHSWMQPEETWFQQLQERKQQAQGKCRWQQNECQEFAVWDRRTCKGSQKEGSECFHEKAHPSTCLKEIAAISKKKSDNGLNMLDAALQDFNYEDMDNMKIDSDWIDSDLDISDGKISEEVSVWKASQDEIHTVDESTLPHTKSISKEANVSLLQSLAQVEVLELFTVPDITTQYASLDNCLNDSLELQSIASLIQGHPSRKKQKSVNLKPLAFVW
jgi:hypothetical protein